MFRLAWYAGWYVEFDVYITPNITFWLNEQLRSGDA